MSRTLPAVVAASLLLAPAMARADSASVAAEPAPATLGWLGNEPAPASVTVTRPRTLLQVIAPVKGEATSQKAGESWIIYMNRKGGRYTPGFNDARINRSSLVKRDTLIAPWSVDEAGWQEVMSCVRDLFADFDVEITDVDPGSSVPHIESIVAGRPGDLEQGNNVGGISPFTRDCSVIPNSIVYTFAEIYGRDYQTVCEVVAQEAAHSFGLDHHLLAADPMSYLPFNGLRRFQDQDVTCGEFTSRNCGLPGLTACSATQNSVRLLAERIGVRDLDAPVVAIGSPANGATVPPGFTVQAEAEAGTALVRVEMWVDGALSASKLAAPFTFATSAALRDGSHSIELRAYDATSVGTTRISVTVKAGAPSTPGNPVTEDPDDGDGGSGDSELIVGGCDAGGGAPGVLVALGIYALVRRRHRRGPPPPR